jgi:hypothetical protein
MNEFFVRQSDMLLGLIARYRSGEIGLNCLIQGVEGICSVIEDAREWNNKIFHIFVTLEEINAIAIEAHRDLTKDEVTIVNRQLFELALLGNHLAEL